MRDGLPSKIGNWYEEGYTVLQLLLLLSEQIQGVWWEPRGLEGVDLVVTVDESEIAIQCKHRSRGSWTLGALREMRGGNSVLGHARNLLEEDASRMYRLVTDRQAPDLEKMSRSARAVSDAETWWAANFSRGREQASLWGLPPDEAETPARVHSLFSRVEVEVRNQVSIERECSNLSRLLVARAGDVDGLLEVLRTTARRGAEDRHGLGVAEVRAALEAAGIALEPRASSAFVHDSITEAARSYRHHVEEVRFLEPIARIARDEAWQAISSLTPGGVVLIHGPAGCGKTEVLAALSHRLEAEGWVTLLTTPDRLGDLGLGDDPAAALRRHAAGRRVVIVLDQLDGVMWGGARTRSLLGPVRDLLRRARAYGLLVAVGCRTADARGESELRHMLSGERGEAPVAVSIGDLDEAEYGPVLAGAGLALAELAPQSKRLASRPLFLRLMRRLLDQGVDLRRVDGLSALMAEVWAQLVRELGDRHVTVFDEIIDRMESEGRLSVRADAIGDPECLRDLVASGLISLEDRAGRTTILPSHQILVDMRIAHRWRNTRTPDDLVARLGDRNAQSFHTGRRLRLAIPLLREHPLAAECLQELVAADTVRPIVKHAVFRGLAEVEDPRDPEIALIQRWMQNDDLRRRVTGTILHGSLSWIAALDEAGGLEELWGSGRSGDQDVVLELLASVSASWGDGVARLLQRWSETDPEVLDRARWVFLQEPGRDTDTLFNLRLESYARGSADLGHPGWSDLLSSHPERAVRLLSSMLPREDFEAIRSDRVGWAMRFPGTGDDTLKEAARIGETAWRHLSPWWNGLGDVDPGRVQTAEGALEDGLLVRIVELLAHCLAAALDSGSLAWDELTEELPHPLRELDGWLLLRTGGLLQGPRCDAPDAALGWVRSEGRWAVLQVGWRGLPWDLAGELVRAASRLASDEAFRETEEWILNYRDRWTAQEERRRWRDCREYGRLLPGRRGALAYHLLPCLPENGRSLRASALLEELRRKFDADREIVFHTMETKGGWVTCSVPPSEAKTWSPSRWMAKLSDAPEDGTWDQADAHSVRTFERGTLLSLLFDLARREPGRYLAHARAFAAPELDEAIAGRARRRLLPALTCTSPPDGPETEPAWAPVEDEEVASVIGDVAYLSDDGLAGTIARAVRERTSHEWPETVLDRVGEIAEVDSARPPRGPDESGLLFDRLNDDSTAALGALAAIAIHHERHRGAILDLAERLAGHADPARRASAAVAAWACRGHDATRAEGVLLNAADDPLVAAERDVGSHLLFLACGEPSATPAGRQARRILLGLASDARPRVAEWGGQVLAVLRRESAIGEDRIIEAGNGQIEVRQGMARMVAKYLADGCAEEWLERLALTLANDEDDGVGGRIARVFAYLDSDHLLDRKKFIASLVHARALERAPFDLLKACDKRAELIPVRRWILEASAKLASPTELQAPQNRWLSGRTACGLLSRLAEEAERCGNLELRSQALDAWDALIERGVHHAIGLLEEIWLEVEPAST